MKYIWNHHPEYEGYQGDINTVAVKSAFMKSVPSFSSYQGAIVGKKRLIDDESSICSRELNNNRAP